jgi:hypothetical protein
MVATPQPNPRRRMPTVLPVAPPNRGAGIMTLPTPRPTAVQRAMATRRPIREPRSLAETFAEGRDVLEGVGTGAIAGLGGLPADLTGIIFGDIPAVINKLVTGETINQEESPYFQQLNEFRETYGAEGIMRLMGAGDRLDAPSDSDDALSRAGINPFRQGAFVGEFLLDPFALAKAPKAIKRAMSPLSEQEERNLIAYERSLRGLDPNPIAARMGYGSEQDPRRRLLPFLPQSEEALEEAFAAAPVVRDEGEEFIVTMPDGGEVSGPEDDLRRLYVEGLAEERANIAQQQQFEQLDQYYAAQGLYDSDATDPDFRIDSVDEQFGFAPNIRQEELDVQYGPNTITMNPDIIPGGLPGGDGVTIFSYVPGLTEGDMVLGTNRGFSFFEFQEDMYDLTGRRIPAGTRIAWPDSMSDEFQNLVHNSPPQPQAQPTVPEPEVRASAEPVPPSTTAAEEIIEGTATEIVSDTPQVGFTGTVDMPLIPTDQVMPMTASLDTQVARHSVMTRDAIRQGDVVDYSPFYQLIDRLPDNRAMSKEEVLDSLRGGFGESVKRDREGSRFIDFLEKHAPNQLYRGQVIALYRDYTPQLRVKSLLQSEVDADAAQGGPTTLLTDFGQYSISPEYGEQMHIYLSNPNSTVPFLEGRTVQTRGGTYAGYGMRSNPGTIADHNIGTEGGPGTATSVESGVPGYFGHIRLKVITDGQGRRIGVLEELQSNTAVSERKFALGRGDEFRFLTGEERYNLDELRDLFPEVFDQAAESRAQSFTASTQGAFLDSLERQMQDTANEFGNDLILLGGVRPSPAETSETIASIYEAAPTGVPSNLDPQTDIAPVTEVLTKLMTGHFLKVIDDADLDRIAGLELSMSQLETASDFAAFRVDGLPVTGRLALDDQGVGEFNARGLSSNNDVTRRVTLNRALKAAIEDPDSSPIDAEDIATLNRVIAKRAREADTIDFSVEGKPSSPDGVTSNLAQSFYADLRDAMDRGETPLEVLLGERNPDNLAAGSFNQLVEDDPGVFGFIGTNVDDVLLTDTSSSVPAMVQRNLQQRITTDVAGTLEVGIFRPTDPSDSISEMNTLIDSSPNISAERSEELKRSFETWVNTINNPSAADAYRPGTPFSGKSSDTYFNQFAVRLMLSEAQKKGLDGVIFPNWEDFVSSSRPDNDVVKEIYETHIKKGLNQAVDSKDVVQLETIEAVNTSTGNLERPQIRGRDHKKARAVYFGDRIRTRRYPPDQRPETGEETYEENLGPLSDVFENKVIRRAKGGPVDLRPKKLIHSGIGGMARQVM